MRSKSGGVNSHQHTHYSLLDGCSTGAQICDRAKELGFKYVMCSDHGNVIRCYSLENNRSYIQLCCGHICIENGALMAMIADFDIGNYQQYPIGVYGFVYGIINKANQKKYIGQTTGSVNRRFSEHMRGQGGRRKNGDISPLYADVLEYGEENFECIGLVVCYSREELDKAERDLIRLNNTLYPNGYNLNVGGQLSRGGVEENTRRRISTSVQKQWHDSEQRKKLLSCPQRQCGYKQSKDVCVKKSIHHARWNRVGVRCIETGDEFDCIKSAAKHYGISESSISNSYRDGRQVCGKYTFASIGNVRKKVGKLPVLCLETGEVFESKRAASKAYGYAGDSSINRALKNGTLFCGMHWVVFNGDDV